MFLSFRFLRAWYLLCPLCSWKTVLVEDTQLKLFSIDQPTFR